MLGHTVKRGVAHLRAVSPEYMAKLHQESELYQNTWRELEVSRQEVLPVLITGVIVFLILASIHYTLGDVVGSLAMIESSSTTAIVETKLPAYADEEPLIRAELDADVEITLLNRKPITASLCGTLRHLRSVGGYFARWRGLGVRILYILLYGLSTNLLGGNPLVALLVTIVLSPMHMLWTHTMIAHPTTRSLRQRLVPLKQCTPLFLPSLVVFAAQRATFLLPIIVGFLLDVPGIPDHAVDAAQRDDPLALALMALRLLAVAATAALLALFVLLPASGTLTRVEASLLPADMQPIVSFDSSFAAPGLSSRALFVAAWRSFDRAAHLRVLKVYARLVGAQFVLALLGMTLLAAEVVVIGGERLVIFYSGVRAELELMAIEKQGGAITG
ncbi:hypothetical protein B0H13DRAFT_1710864 [Mycena leptocephala]|nr:hypothetical protein B0H13DRAFT_1710864 [Mycena leptocephala]